MMILLFLAEPPKRLSIEENNNKKNHKDNSKPEKVDDQCQTDHNKSNQVKSEDFSPDDQNQQGASTDKDQNNLNNKPETLDTNGDKPKKRRSVTIKSDSESDLDKDSAKHFPSETSVASSNQTQTDSIESQEPSSGKSESSGSATNVNKNNNQNDQIINYALTHTAKRRSKQVKDDCNISSKIDLLAAATLKLQDLVSVPVTRKLYTRNSESFEDIFLQNRGIYPTIFSNRSQIGCNTDSRSSVSQEKFTQAGRKHKPYRKRGSNNQDILPQPFLNNPTFTSVANLSLFSGQKESLPEILNTSSKTRSKKRKTVKASEFTPDNKKNKSNVGFDNSFKRSNHVFSSSSSEQGPRRYSKPNFENGKCRTRPVSCVNRNISFVSTNSSTRSTNLEDICYSRNKTRTSLSFPYKDNRHGKEYLFADTSRSVDDDIRVNNNRKYSFLRICKRFSLLLVLKKYLSLVKINLD